MMCWCVFLLQCLSRSKLTCQTVCVCGRLAWGACGVSGNLSSQSVMQEWATLLLSALLPSVQCVCLSACVYARAWCAYVLFAMSGEAGWRRVVCRKGYNIKVLWRIPSFSFTISPFICEVHFISLPYFLTVPLSSNFYSSSMTPLVFFFTLHHHSTHSLVSRLDIGSHSILKSLCMPSLLLKYIQSGWYCS